MQQIIRSRVDLAQIFIKAIRLPALLFIVGALLAGITWLEPYYPQLNSYNVVYIAMDVGNVLMALSGVLFIYFTASLILDVYERTHVEQNKRTTLHVLATIRKGIKIVFLFLALHVIVSIFEIKNEYLATFNKVIIIFVIASITWILLQLISILEMIFYDKYTAAAMTASYGEVRENYTRVHQARNIISILIVIIAVASSLMVFNNVRNIGISILASAGFITAIIGLAAQKTLGSLFAGVQLVFSRPFHIGDVVTVDNQMGAIEEITLNFVMMKMWDSSRVVFPISYFIDKPFQTWSRSDQGLLNKVKLYLDYSTPVEALREALNEILADSPYWDKRINILKVSDVREQSIEISIILSAGTLDDLDNLCAQVREKLLVFIGKNDGGYFPRTRVASLGNVNNDKF